MIVGPGYWLLISIHSFEPWPSGLHVVFVISRLYLTVTPVLGHLRSKSVAKEKPLDQHERVKGPFLQLESATAVVFAGLAAEVVADCRATSFIPEGFPSRPQRMWSAGMGDNFSEALAATPDTAASKPAVRNVERCIEKQKAKSKKSVKNGVER